MNFKYHGLSLEEYIKQDRQWLRHVRIAFAAIQGKNATTDAEREFWHSVLNANGAV